MPGIFGVGVVDVQGTVAEVVFLGVRQQNLVPVHYGEQVLVRKPEGVDFFQSRPADHVHGQIFPQCCQIQHHHAGVHIGRTCRDIQAAVIEPGQGLPDMGAGNVIIACKLHGVQLPQGVNHQGIYIQIENSVQVLRQQQRRCQTVENLPGVAAALREALKVPGIHRHKAAVHPVADGFDGPKILFGQVRVENIGVIRLLAPVFHDGAKALAEQRAEALVDAEQQVHLFSSSMNSSPVMVSFR